MATPNFVLSRNVSVTGENFQNNIDLSAGTFVRPIDPVYVPKHILDAPMNRWFNEKTEFYCYTPKGILIIPKDAIRKV